MEIPFIKNIIKEQPKFWKNYLMHFENKNEISRYVVFECEATGLDADKDKIITIRAIAIENDAIHIKDYMEVFIKQTEIPSQGNEEKVIEAEAIIQFLNFIKSATLVGYSVSFDIDITNQALDRLDLGKLKNEYMDITIMYQKYKNLNENTEITLDELYTLFNIKKMNKHMASTDVYTMALLFLKLKKKLGI